MLNLKDILFQIDKQTTEEIKGSYLNPSIGRGDIMMMHGGKGRILSISIVNKEYKPKSVDRKDINGFTIGRTIRQENTEYEKGGIIVVPKNREPARTLLLEYQGHHSKAFIDNIKRDFLIKNSAHYNNTGREVLHVSVGVSGDKSWSFFPKLKDAISRFKALEQSIKKKQKAEEQARDRLNDIQSKIKKFAGLESEEERRLKEEQSKLAEEARLIAEDIEKQKNQRNKILDEYRKAHAFIRDQVSLRRNPVLDKEQMTAKFSHIYDGAAVVINGGPGTGKTTTMIQRLKLLIDKGDLTDYRINHQDCRLTDEQLDIISSIEDNWIFFSPNNLLKKYLEDNMNYEGLTETNKRTAVWKDFLNDAVRDEYQLVGNDCHFKLINEKKADRYIYKANYCAIIEDFTLYFISQVKEIFVKIGSMETSKFDWKILGSVITKECAKIKTVENIEQLLKFLIGLENIDRRISVDGKEIPSASDIVSSYNEDLKVLVDKYILILKRDKTKYEEVVLLIKSQSQTSQLAEDSQVDVEEDDVYIKNIDIKIVNRIKGLLKKLALKTIDSSINLNDFQLKLNELLQGIIDKEEIKSLSHSAYFEKYINPAFKPFSSYVLSPIHKYYKRYRKYVYDKSDPNWDGDLLKEMLGRYKNAFIYNQEQSLLVGFINNMAKALYKVNTEKFKSETHKYIQAYKNLCRPVIGVDEATDYSLIDYYGIKSFGHYAVCSYTLCGDIMQLMKEDGVTDWTNLKNSLLFDKMHVYNLNVSYRQSESLLNLADKIFEMERGYKSPYKCYIKGHKTPNPLWIESNDIDDKSKWISYRVLEIVKAYDNKMPTIAIFTKNIDTAKALADAIKETKILDAVGIKVQAYSNNNLEEYKTLHIFPINQVKGMEFEAVFFYDIDEIESSSLINKYLYIGLSRASMYLAVTSSGHSEKVSGMLKAYFEQGGVWA